LEKLKEKDHLREACRRMEDNIKMDFTDIRCEDVDWIRLDQGRKQKRVLLWNLRFLKRAGDFLTS
jgi:hypothetical protein